MSDGLDYDRLHEERQARPDGERLLIEKAEREWRARITEQEENKEIAKVALVRLVQEMPNLQRIEIDSWVYDMKEFGFDDDYVE